MNQKRIPRLLRLLRELCSGAGQNADAIAKACGVTRRTAFRDLATLREAGTPICFVDGRYSIAPDYFLPPTNFTLREALALVLLVGRQLSPARLPLVGPIRSAAAKLQCGLPPALQDRLKHVAQSVDVRVNQANRLPGKEAVFDCLTDAIARRVVVRLDYSSLNEPHGRPTILRPYHLMFNRRSWYVIGRSSLHKAVRTFNVGRIQSVEMTDRNYVLPKRFSVDRYLGNAWNLIPEDGPDFHVSVRFSTMMARSVAEVTWHKTQRVEFLPDGSLKFSALVSGLDEVGWWVLGYGDHAEVLHPLKLRRLVAQRARNMCAIYDRPNDASRTRSPPLAG